MREPTDTSYVEISEAEKAEFLKDLTELTTKHGIVIHGCGCCGSPSLSVIGEGEGAYVQGGMGNPEIAWRLIDFR